MMPTPLKSIPKKPRIEDDSAEADRQHLLFGDESGDHCFSNDDSGPDVGAGSGGHIALSSIDPANRSMGADEEGGHKPENRPGDGWAWNLALGSAATLGLTSWITMVWTYTPELGWFTFHPPLQALAICCFTYGIMTLQPTGQPKTKVAGLERHQTAMFYIAFPLITLGTSAIIFNKYMHSADHFKTWHGTFGLLCMLWILAQIFVGAGSVWNGGAFFGGGMRAKVLWKYHRMSGYALLPLLLFTTHLGGGWSNWATGNINSIVRFVAYTLAPVAILASVYSRVRLYKMRFW